MKLYSSVTLLFLIWLVAILFISYFGFLTLPHSGNFSEDFFKSLANWDGGHFLGIAQYGYSEKFQYAFFPLYPLTINILNKLTNNYLLAAVLISSLASFLGMHLLYRLTSFHFDKKIAEKVFLSLLFFPTSFYFLTAYSEGLFFLLVIACFYNLSQNKLFLATVFASLASITRLAGLALILGLFVEILTTGGINKRNWYVSLAPLGFLIYCWYLYTKVQDPFYFLTAELHWQRDISLPAVSFWETIKNLSQVGFVSKHMNVFLDLLFAVFGLGMGIRTFRFLPISFAVYSLASILLPLFTPTLSSMPRFLLPIFPIFILLSLYKKKSVNLAYQMISLMLLAIFSVLFVNGYWVS